VQTWVAGPRGATQSRRWSFGDYGGGRGVYSRAFYPIFSAGVLLGIVPNAAAARGSRGDIAIVATDIKRVLAYSTIESHGTDAWQGVGRLWARAVSI